MKQTAHSRQGDVLLLRISGEAPKRGQLIPRDGQGRIVLAHGEVTGHAHAIHDAGADLYTIDVNEKFAKIMNDSGIEVQVPLTPSDRILEVKEATVVHEEHGAHDKLPGLYLVRLPMEYVENTPERARRIAD